MTPRQGKQKIVRWRDGIHRWNIDSVAQGQEPLPLALQAVCFHLAQYVAANDPLMAVKPSQATLAQLIGCHVNTVASALKVLQKIGLVAKIGKHNQHTTATWALLMHPTMAGFDEVVATTDCGYQSPESTLVPTAQKLVPTIQRVGTHNSLGAELEELEDLEALAPASHTPSGLAGTGLPPAANPEPSLDQQSALAKCFEAVANAKRLPPSRHIA
jgi:hypothetical protein